MKVVHKWRGNNVQGIKRQNKYKNSLFVNSICNDIIFYR